MPSSGSSSREPISLPAQIIPSSRSADGCEQIVSEQVITHWRQERRCLWCGVAFRPKWPAAFAQRFCGTSCSNRWKILFPEIKEKTHTPQTHAKIAVSVKRWMTSGHPTAEVQKDHFQAVKGGSGRPLTKAQSILLVALGSAWTSEHTIQLGVHLQDGVRKEVTTYYKADLANISLRIDIEADGNSHSTPRKLHKDQQRDSRLASLGWKVLRFSNKMILDWHHSGMPMESFLSTTLASHDIQVIR